MAALGEVMKILISAACIAVLAFVGYFFWGEYEKRQALQEMKQAVERVEQANRQAALEERDKEKYKVCSDAVARLQAIIDANISSESDVYSQVKSSVDDCLRTHKGSSWYDKNIHIKKW